MRGANQRRLSEESIGIVQDQKADGRKHERWCRQADLHSDIPEQVEESQSSFIDSMILPTKP
jgi:hypothetical protein